MGWKDKKAFPKDMKEVYTAPNKEAAAAALEDFAEKWESKYSYAIKSWRDNWDELTVFFDYPVEIRNLYHQPDRKPQWKGQKIHQKQAVLLMRQ
ncbi:hypothetical protein GCM10011339_42880 [Echinicola rosea]|uniref:Mutator family transposase n=1 Tax=Echinicola rosea TaxID=1807691 RepID=A0ABQ1VB93_9BACT|nr:hypothetical protein GCM10011339_42880 [Echinicola rosea]